MAYLVTKYSDNNITNSALTVLAGFVFSKITFVILFHIDNKKKYTKRFTGKLNVPVLKMIVKKMIVADSIFEVINNGLRFLVLLELLKMNYLPAQAAIIASLIASCFSYLAINVVVKKIHIFGPKRRLL